MTPAKTLMASMAASAALIATAAIAQPIQGGAKFKTTLLGASEVPGPGDPDGKGQAEIIVNPGKSTICWVINVHDIEPANLAHIHIGLAGQAGPVVLGLSPPTDGDSEGCEDVPRTLSDAIRKSPASYYVNVHNGPYPNGALRGQLG